MRASRRAIIRAIVAGATGLGLSTTASAEPAMEWPQFKFDAGNTGAATDRRVPGSVETKWRYSADRAIESAPAIADGRCFVGANDGDLHAIDASSGTGLWRTGVGSEVRSAPAVAGQTVCIGGRTDNYGLDVETGEKRWSWRTTASAVQTAPTVAGRSVYLSRGDEAEAIEARFHASGDHRVTFETPLGPTTPAVADGSIVAGFEDGSVTSFDTRITNEEWSRTGESPIRAAPVVARIGDQDEASVITVDRDGVVRAINAASGRPRWEYDLGGVSGSPAVSANRIVIGTGGFSLQAFNASGTPVWSREFGGRVVASPVLARNTVVVGAGSTLYALRSDSGSTRWSVDLEGTVTRRAAIAGGYVFVATDAGHCYALGPSDDDFGEGRATTTTTDSPTPTATATATPTPTAETRTPTETPTPTQAPTETTTGSPAPDTDGSTIDGLIETIQSVFEGLFG